jgi:hypothetical protein
MSPRIPYVGAGIVGRDDNIVTTFCGSVTPRCEAANRSLARFATKELGEAMAPASEREPSGGTCFGAGAPPVFFAVLLALAACGDDGPSTINATPAQHAGSAVADPARGMHTVLDVSAPSFGEALLAELTGDDAGARAGFERVLSASDAPPALSARAALHLARMDARAGKTRHALDLVARAAALAPSDVVVAEGVAQVEAEVGARGAGDIPGPPLGTPLPGVAPKVAQAFAAAERALERVHKLHPRPFIEALSSSIRLKEDATEDAVAKYREVAEHGGLAQIAASYRIGSLYHDLAVGLVFDLPPELDPNVAAGLRRWLAGQALIDLRRAVTAYRACLAAPALPEDKLWRVAAETDLRAALDLLGEGSDGPRR